MTQNQISINVKMAAVDVYVRITLSYPKAFYVKIIKNSKLLFLLHSLKSCYNTHRGWTQIEYQNKHYNIDQKDEGT
jgi:hypothetical protein